MYNRGLLIGALAFAAAMAAERLFSSMAGDLARYDRMRKMSGEGSLVKELLGTIGGFVGERTREQKDAAAGIVGMLTNDVVRYAKLRGM